ncbi:MAG: hypothetical protein D3924_10450, partial [Candidatus Electrothrix sp. AR4]|nr:hypothetical protein [Candidatus Electrothrix sp. AR4]
RSMIFCMAPRLTGTPRTEEQVSERSETPECFNCFTAVSVNTADLADQGCESRAETGLEFAGYVSFAGFTAGCTFTLIKDEMNDRHNNFGEFDGWWV